MGHHEQACDRADGCGILDVYAFDVVSGETFSVATRGVVDWVLTARGRLIIVDGGRRGGWDTDSPRRVRVVWYTGHSELAAGADLDPGSLAVGEHRVFWTRGGVPESAPLP